MQYIGQVSGTGFVTGYGMVEQRVSYELDGYRTRQGQIIGSGEIWSPTGPLSPATGRESLRLRTQEGGTLELRFTEPMASGESGAAHVDVIGWMK